MVITLTELKDFLGITDTNSDDYLQQIVDATNDYIERVTKRAWGEIKVVTDEIYDYDAIVFLRKVAIQTVSAIKIGYDTDTTTLDDTAYRWNEAGRILLTGDVYRSRSTQDFDELKVSYTYGQSPVPDDLKLAALQSAAGTYSGSTSGEKVSEEAVGSRRVKYSTSVAESVINKYTIV